MKKLFLLVCTVLSINLFSQVFYRLIYEYKSVNDSLDKENQKKEIYFLDILKNKSLFYNNEDRIKDSLLSKTNESAINTSDIIEKITTSHEILQYTKLSENTYLIKDNRALNWKISNERQEILNFKSQKAPLNFAGRNWEAWFTTDIPIQNGPYKFSGLPGLIIKVNDETNSHCFQLIGIQKNLKPTYFHKKKNISITYEKYKKLYKQTNDNPLIKLKQSPIKVSENSSTEEDAELTKNMEKFFNNRIKRNNNILEIDLLK